ncbi:MAG: DUF4339 domain-containing protein [Methylocystis sp.]|jgi:hypothetical protein
MDAEWYYAEDGKTVGPMSAGEIASRIAKAKNQPHFIWTEGMPGWTDASTVPEFAAGSQVSRVEAGAKTIAASCAEHASLAQRARRELIEYLGISAYLYVCFGALIFYKATILHSEGIAFAPLGIAIVKALILGKFILVLRALKIGERGTGGIPLARMIKKSLLFALLLMVLTVIEELIVGYFHGRESREILHEIAGGTLSQAFAVAMLLFLILIPYFAFQEITARLGEGKLSKLLAERPRPENQE